MASRSQARFKTFTAGEDLSSKQYTFVKFGSDNETVLSCAANERAIGILQNDPTSGGAAEVALPGGGANLKVSEAVSLGNLLTSTAAGLGEVADAAGEWCGALAYDSGVANDVIYVEVIATQAQASEV